MAHIPLETPQGAAQQAALVERPERVRLAEPADGVGGAVRPLNGPPGPGIRFNDLATPFEGPPCDCPGRGADGIDDMVLMFSTDEMAEALQLDSVAAGTSLMLTLTGYLHEGTTFDAVDCISIVGWSVTRLHTDMHDQRSGKSRDGLQPRGAKALPRTQEELDSDH